MEKAEGGASALGGGGGPGEGAPGDATGLAAAAQRQRVAELNGRVERMARQLKSSADREVASLAQGLNSIKNVGCKIALNNEHCSHNELKLNQN